MRVVASRSNAGALACGSAAPKKASICACVRSVMKLLSESVSELAAGK